MADNVLIIAILGAALLNLQGSFQDGNSLICDLYDEEKGISNGTRSCDNSIGDGRCFALWRKRKNKKNETLYTVIKKGCFEFSFDGWTSHTCLKDCIQDQPYNNHESKNVSGFCCCSEDMCNRNFTPVEFNKTSSTVSSTTLEADSKDKTPNQRVVVIVACSFFVILTSVMVLVVWYIYKLKYKKKVKYTATEEDEKDPPCPVFDLSGLHLQQLVGNGQYGSVWKASLNGQTVAVKVFRPQHRDTWLTEREVYENPGLSHPNILKFFVAVEREREENCPEYFLLTEYHSEGSLKQYLQHNTVSWYRMCILSRSVAAGLAYLHQDDEHKPSFVHRDLSSRNILVKNDGSCVLSDFGFAMRMSGCESPKPSDDNPFITEVGTLRYMAPEVLDGAVNLRECHASLKEIDVYAMALVLWEIAMRCTDIFGRHPVPEYRPPFEAELGEHICSEHMQEFVAKQKRRPGFPDAWKHNHPGPRSLKETIEDCWDQDGDARLSALCVQERLSELLKDYPNGLAATTSANVLPSVQHNFTSTHSQSLSGFGVPRTNAPPVVVPTNPWADRSSSVGMTTV